MTVLSLSDDSGVQGLIKFSATVLGPGDIQKVHDPVNEEKEAEEVINKICIDKDEEEEIREWKEDSSDMRSTR